MKYAVFIVCLMNKKEIIQIVSLIFKSICISVKIREKTFKRNKLIFFIMRKTNICLTYKEFNSAVFINRLLILFI